MCLLISSATCVLLRRSIRQARGCVTDSDSHTLRLTNVMCNCLSRDTRPSALKGTQRTPPLRRMAALADLMHKTSFLSSDSQERLHVSYDNENTRGGDSRDPDRTLSMNREKFVISIYPHPWKSPGNAFRCERSVSH